MHVYYNDAVGYMWLVDYNHIVTIILINIILSMIMDRSLGV